MINYTLNFGEDLCEEITTKKIICLGTPSDIEDRFKSFEYLYQSIECCCAINHDYHKPHYPFSVVGLSFLESIDVSNYILLIIDSNVDDIKESLSKLSICKRDEKINCYKLPLNKRYYLNRTEVITKRYTTCLDFWQKYVHEMLGNGDDASKTITHCIPRVVLVLTTKCNLRCKECIALTPHYKSGYHVPLSILIKSLDSFLSSVNYCYCLELLGGEPFLYTYIDDLLMYLIRNNKVVSIQITTNGLVDIKKSTLDLLANPKIHIRISDYNINLPKKRLIQDKLLAANVNFWVHSDIVWIPVGDICKRNAVEQTLKDEYSLCFEGLNCKTILNGKLYACTFASRIADLDFAQDIEYIDLLEKNLKWEQLFEFWIKTYSSACDYCRIMNPNSQYVPSAVQI